MTSQTHFRLIHIHHILVFPFLDNTVILSGIEPDTPTPADGAGAVQDGCEETGYVSSKPALRRQSPSGTLY
ncbi:MAG: hypothetical protein FJ031_10690 [Chloroflexi bacterium]|nr:hypothetical protein [Chloroflexota bacterium]